MSKSAMIRARTEQGLKTEVETIFHELGISATEAINLFYKQVKLHNGLPFRVKIPNKVTLQTFKNTDAGKDLVKCKDADDFFNKLGI
ncbi:MAG: type II toxin-antitoxin system RelB/DinJ family antitoxin [Nitrospirae bacterium]|nr:type II toxin-antitoxin system RelB/DinJ family antitoxin [Nitrospirota bacterium]